MLDELYSNAYIYTLPSDLEGMPLSLLEAMSYGNACLVSDIPECTEVVEDKAIIFRKSNIKDLTEKLQDACDDIRKVGKLKEQAADFMLKCFIIAGGLFEEKRAGVLSAGGEPAGSDLRALHGE